MGRTASASTYSLVRVFTKLSKVSTLALRLTSSSPLAPYRHAERTGGTEGSLPLGARVSVSTPSTRGI